MNENRFDNWDACPRGDQLLELYEQSSECSHDKLIEVAQQFLALIELEKPIVDIEKAEKELAEFVSGQAASVLTCVDSAIDEVCNEARKDSAPLAHKPYAGFGTEMICRIALQDILLQLADIVRKVVPKPQS